MTAKEYLQQIRRLNREIDQDIAERGAVALRVESIGAVDYAKDRVQGTPGRTLEDAIVRLSEYDDRINSEVDALIDAKKHICEELRQLRNYREQSVLWRHYINGDSFEQIAVSMNIEYRWVRRLHKRGLEHFEELHGASNFDPRETP